MSNLKLKNDLTPFHCIISLTIITFKINTNLKDRCLMIKNPINELNPLLKHNQNDIKSLIKKIEDFHKTLNVPLLTESILKKAKGKGRR